MNSDSKQLGEKYALLEGRSPITAYGMKDAKSFVPVPADIWPVETALDAHLKKNFPKLAAKYSNYYRQYGGAETATDGKVIFGNFMCSKHHPKWESVWQATDDGGDCYFDFAFRVKDLKFIEFVVNGEA